MLRTVWIALLLAVPPLAGQFVTADNCVHQAGDNPDWARPDFDDRQWSKEFPTIGSPYVWTRCRLDLKSLQRVDAIHIGVAAGFPWELFVDGQPAGSGGDMRSGFKRWPPGQSFPLLARTEQREALSVALRQLPGRDYLGIRGSLIAAGHADSLRMRASDASSRQLRSMWPEILAGAISLVIGYVLLILFAMGGGGGQREMLWFGLFSLVFGAFRAYNTLRALFVDMPGWLYLSADGLLFAAMYLAIPKMFFAMAGRPLPRFYAAWSWVYAFFSLIPAMLSLFAPVETVQRFAPMTAFRIPLGLLSHSAAIVAFWPLWRIPGPLRWYRNLSLLWAAGALAFVAPSVPWFRGFSGRDFRDFTVIVTLLGMFLVIARRHRQIVTNRAELQAEMRSAREVQHLLTSSALDAAPWASVDVWYLPAKEVGGDFYFCRQAPEGQLTVVGDVSGKGLRAAMLASVALGALRHSKTSSPGSLLEGLNDALMGQTGGGFVTCCAVLLGEDGRLTVANAGHPAPYLDGSELTLEAGLPIGIVAGATYKEHSFQGQRVALVSDGVIEAENAQRELFGFERTRAISAKSAREIAEAAKAWGQNDDITVVTVRRNQ